MKGRGHPQPHRALVGDTSPGQALPGLRAGRRHRASIETRHQTHTMTPEWKPDSLPGPDRITQLRSEISKHTTTNGISSSSQSISHPRGLIYLHAVAVLWKELMLVAVLLPDPRLGARWGHPSSSSTVEQRHWVPQGQLSPSSAPEEPHISPYPRHRDPSHGATSRRMEGEEPPLAAPAMPCWEMTHFCLKLQHRVNAAGAALRS